MDKADNNLDTLSAFLSESSENISDLSQNSTVFDKNAKNIENSAKNQGSMCKNQAIFNTVIEQNNDNNHIAPDPVSSLSDDIIVKNEADNFKQISEEEDKLLFSKAFPGVNPENIKKDRLFAIFADGKGKSKSLTSIYSDFRLFVAELSSEIRKKHKFNDKIASPGSLSSSEPSNDGFFTKEQVLRMSKDEICKNYDKIRRSQQKW